MAGKGGLRVKFPLLLLLIGVWVGGCAQPIETTVLDVARDPTRFRNKQVQMKGRVVRNVVEGDVYATWHLTLVGDGEEVLCHEEGWNTGVMRQGWNLAERAKEDGGQVVVTGTVRVRHREMARGQRVDLRSIAYEDHLIHTDYDDFPPFGWAGRYPYPLLLWPYPWRYRYGPFFPHDWYFPYRYPYYRYRFP